MEIRIGVMDKHGMKFFSHFTRIDNDHKISQVQQRVRDIRQFFALITPMEKWTKGS